MWLSLVSCGGNWVNEILPSLAFSLLPSGHEEHDHRHTPTIVVKGRAWQRRQSFETTSKHSLAQRTWKYFWDLLRTGLHFGPDRLGRRGPSLP